MKMMQRILNHLGYFKKPEIEETEKGLTGGLISILEQKHKKPIQLRVCTPNYTGFNLAFEPDETLEILDDFYLRSFRLVRVTSDPKYSSDLDLLLGEYSNMLELSNKIHSFSEVSRRPTEEIFSEFLSENDKAYKMLHKEHKEHIHYCDPKEALRINSSF